MTGSETFVVAAGNACSLVPGVVADALAAFRANSGRSGALVLRGLPVGDLPSTPPTPTSATSKPAVSEMTLLTVARCLGEPVGYEPELGGSLVQNIVPVKSSSDRQVSTSSKVALQFHTEAAFHPHSARYLLLLCLKGDKSATTTLASIAELLPLLTDQHVDVLFQPRFRTAIDESYLHGRTNTLGDPVAVLSGSHARPTLVFDAELMQGIDPDATDALAALADAVAGHHTGVVLDAGDLIVLDNAAVVHGRSPFAPRFDGTDRWLQRTFVVEDLAASANERVGRVITTSFGV